jgi:hypothetical protein
MPSGAYGHNHRMDAFSTSYHCDCQDFISHEHGRKRIQEFTAKYADKIHGVLSGFDRLIFSGISAKIAYDLGMKSYLWAKDVLLKAFDSRGVASIPK